MVSHSSWITLGISDLPAEAPVFTHAALDRCQILVQEVFDVTNEPLGMGFFPFSRYLLFSSKSYLKAQG